MKTILITTLLVLASATAYGKTLNVNPDRTIVINKAIRGDILDETNQLMALAGQSKKPIYILINSPGGSVFPGLQFITAMSIAKHRGISVRCVVPFMAASMGFQFYVNCSKRYAFKNSMLLWHPMKLSGAKGLAASDLLYQGSRITQLERPLIEDIMKALKITPKVFKHHYKHETMWTASQLQRLSPEFLIIINDVKGVKGLFKTNRRSF